MSATDNRLPWHDAQWRRLADARSGGRLPHAILLTGVSGVGKSGFARRLGKALVCPSPDAKGEACGTCKACRLSAAGSHPDLHWSVPEDHGKAIKIDAIRALTTKSVLSAERGGYRVIGIDPADAMNKSAANALLKTLEEPSSRTVLILVSSRAHLLPATIRSRCHVVSFPVPASAVGREWLAAQGTVNVEEVLALSGGAPLRARDAGEQGWLDADKKLIAELEALKRRKGNPLHVVEEWGNRPLTLVFDGFKRCLADLVRMAYIPGRKRVYHSAVQGDLQSLGQGIDLKRLYEFNDELLQFERYATNNLNSQMMLEYLANRWLELTRPGVR